ncbi:hypothetical protein [Blastococcus sp. SYSU D00813]
MALVVGELTAYLNVDKSGYTAGLRDAKGDMQGLARDAKVSADGVGTQTERIVQQVGQSMTRLTRDASGKLRNARGQFATDLEIALAGLDPVAERRGQESGGKLAQGMRQSIVRNSPLIVAGIAGALAAGAPAAIAGATTLFGGIGIVAAAQNEKVQASWAALWQDMKSGAQQDAAALVPVVEGMADKFGQSFQRMRPAIRDAFEASAPIIDDFTDSLTRAAENALPGLVRAVQASGPVMAGLGSMLESVGTGLTGFFDAMSAHAPAAGQAFAAIGDILEALLPILGELLGQGAELAAVVLPPLASVLGVVADALSSVGGALPAVIAGFTGMKIVNGLSSGLTSLSTRLGEIGAQGGIAAGAASRLSGSVGGVAGALSRFAGPAAAVAAGALLVATNFEKMERDAQTAARGLIEGGNAARQAADLMGPSIAGMNAGWVDAVDGAMQYASYLPIVGQASEWAWDLITTTSQESAEATRQAYDDMIGAMSPLQRAQADVTYWTNELAAAQGNSNYVMKDREGNVVTLAEAQGRLAIAERDAARYAAQLDQDATGMSRTLAQAAEAADELQSALDALNGGQLDLNEANREYQQSLADIQERLAGAREGIEGYGMTLDLATEAGRANSQALDDFAASAAASADAVYRQTGSYDQFTVAMVNGRNALYDSARAFGMTDTAARAYVDSVLGIPPVTAMNIETNTDTVRAELDRLMGQLTGLPPGQAVVTWASPEVIRILDQLGYDIVGLPSGEVRITATDEATPITDEVLVRMGLIDATTATGTIDADNTAFTGIASAALDTLGFIAAQHPTPTLDANGAPLHGAADAALNALLGVDQQRPTPVVNANPAPFNSAMAAANAAVAGLAGQRPTPVAGLNSGPLLGTANGAINALANLGAQRPTAVASLVDNASGIAGRIAGALNSIPRNITSTVTTIQRTVQTFAWAAASGGKATPRGVFPVGPRFDRGGEISGPGGPTDDLVQAWGPMGPLRVSNNEWIIRAAAAALYGDRKMAAVNAGTAQIILPSERPRVRAFADGGPAGGTSSAVAEAAGTVIEVRGDVVVKVETPLNLANDRDLRQAGERIRKVLVQLDRETVGARS